MDRILKITSNIKTYISKIPISIDYNSKWNIYSKDIVYSLKYNSVLVSINNYLTVIY